MKKVVYSAIVGDYDSIVQPLVLAEEFDYILFSNDIHESHIGVWQIRKIPYYNKDNIRIARWVKTHPYTLLQDYKYSIWIDSNVIIKSEEVYKHTDNLFNQGVLISSMAHYERTCIYEECLEVAVKKRDSLHKILPEYLFLKHHQYPYMNGLCETNFVFRNHQDPKIQKLCEDWWKMIDKFSRRDQLSFNYVIWANKLSLDLFLGKMYCTRNHPFFECHLHKDLMYEYKTWLRFLEPTAKKIYRPAFKYLLLCPNGSWKETWAMLYLYMMEFFLNQTHQLYCNRTLRKIFASIKRNNG